MVRYAISATLLFALAVAGARAQDTGLYSKTFTFRGNCTGVDMVYSWSLDSAAPGDGRAPPPGQYGRAFIYPWTEGPITIRGVEVVDTAPARLSGYLLGAPYFGFLMVGNDVFSDIMLMMGPGESHATNMFPNAGFGFPGKTAMTPVTYIDLHGSCRWPRTAQMLLTLYYTYGLK
jgi:hypothetical protein